MKRKLVFVTILLAFGTAKAVDAWGPTVVVPQTRWAVNTPTPSCEGSVTADDFLNAIAPVYEIIPGGEELIGWMQENGYGSQRHQDYAECRPVCAAVPNNVAISEENIFVYWADDGVTFSAQPYGKAAYGRWDAGTGYHRIDPGFAVHSFPDGQLVCKTVRNWATHSRMFRMEIRY